MIGFYIFNEDEEIAKNIKEALMKNIKEDVTISITDLSVYNDTPKEVCVFFGLAAKSAAHGQIKKSWTLPCLKKLTKKKENIEKRKEAMSKLQEIASWYNEHRHIEETKPEVYAVKNGIKIGDMDEVDVRITDNQLDHLVKLKELLGSCEIIIQKEDLEIRIS